MSRPEDLPSGKDVTYEEPEYDEQTGLPIHEERPWSAVAEWLVKEASEVLSGERRTLSVRASEWLLAFAETFDLSVEFTHGNEAGDPLWTLKGNVPLDSGEMSLTKAVKAGLQWELWAAG